MVRITRSETGSELVRGVVPWSYAESDRLRMLLREREGALAAEVNEAAGLDWRVVQTAAFMFVGGEPSWDTDGVLVEPLPAGQFKLVGGNRSAKRHEPSLYLNVRDDLYQVVGIVKKRYRILQNDQAPRVLDHLVSAGELRYRAAGALHGGAQVWWLANVPSGSIAVRDAEALHTYILLTNSHDGSTSVTASILSVHAGTQTTLAWPLPTAARTIAIRHTESGKQALEATRVLELAAGYRRALERLSRDLVATRLTERQFTSFIETLVLTPPPIIKNNRVANQRGITLAENTKGLIRLAYSRNEALAALRGTLFGALLACQYYADHMAINRTTEDATPVENRFKRLTSENNLGAKALHRALELLR